MLAQRSPVIHEAPIHCPECNAALLPRIHDNVPIDVCAPCKAVWLDGDELLMMAKMILPKKKPTKGLTLKERNTANGNAPASRTFGADLGDWDTDDVVLAVQLLGATVIAMLD